MNAVSTEAVKGNLIRIEHDHVRKEFVGGGRLAQRFRREVEALRRLHPVAEVPDLYSHSPDRCWLIMERIPGTPLSQSTEIPASLTDQLGSVVDRMLQHGVARHSLPARDVIVRPDGGIGLVDFERCTLRRWRISPVWWIACQVTRFNLLRLISDYAPQQLTPAGRRRLNRQYKIRKGFHMLRKGLRLGMRAWRRFMR